MERRLILLVCVVATVVALDLVNARAAEREFSADLGENGGFVKTLNRVARQMPPPPPPPPEYSKDDIPQQPPEEMSQFSRKKREAKGGGSMPTRKG